MGIDYPDVRLVAHMQAPANIESLYQEMGRAGRDGLMSRCLLLYAKKDKGLHSFFINQSNAPEAVISQKWRSLDAIIQYIESSECRHGGILTYFRDHDRIEACGHCDICAPHSEWVVLRPESLSKRAQTKLRKASKQQPGSIESPDAEARALVLRDWRKRFSRERDIPAFIVFSDRTLRDLANKNPKSLTELESIYGLGPAKIELFGSEVLRELGNI
jgi:ATP-dependent DNA helicase RecQ